ncbi:hypothetical protein C8N36_1407 [Pelagimonas varians]|uniref:Uncharacterized protein n=1 Tax=Pelagimonas varians TaxID=696760 RepID=A0A238L6C0_9RHOB|nr:hypothetical protein C8N36_1407 [Pelagimonas varians]SMX50635.1 hypothetical protein PEV8663_04739 [Pelagimonas varians]
MAPLCVNIGGGDVVEALAVSVVPNEGGDVRLKIIRQEVVLQQDTEPLRVFRRLQI